MYDCMSESEPMYKKWKNISKSKVYTFWGQFNTALNYSLHSRSQKDFLVPYDFYHILRKL